MSIRDSHRVPANAGGAFIIVAIAMSALGCVCSEFENGDHVTSRASSYSVEWSDAVTVTFPEAGRLSWTPDPDGHQPWQQDPLDQAKVALASVFPEEELADTIFQDDSYAVVREGTTAEGLKYTVLRKVFDKPLRPGDPLWRGSGRHVHIHLVENAHRLWLVWKIELLPRT